MSSEHGPGGTTPPPGPSKIRHTTPGIGAPGSGGTPAPAPARPSETDDALPVVGAGAGGGMRQIRALGEKRRHEDEWSRIPNTTGHGAIHVRTFHSKLTDDALRYLDQAVNEWLDAHPQYEVKFVTTTVGVLTGKLKEPHLICQVWV
ncbi:MAG: hypothetical protein KDA25_10680 [Phycisphaerales bacterium]|nr:hypothetical protein [Phycisphaerales bacterium]